MDTINRKTFLQTCTAALAAGAVQPVFSKKNKNIRKKNGMYYRKLGRTGLWISEIGNGGSPSPSASVFSYTLKKGVNWFDTSSTYESGKSEEAYGKYLKKVKRDDFVVMTKMHAQRASTPTAEIIEEVEGSLKRLGRDTIDILLLHGLKNEDQLTSTTIHSSFEKLKKAGKIRFAGVSLHKNFLELLPKLVEINYHDVVLVGFNVYSKVNVKKYDNALGEFGLTKILEQAHKKGIGIIAMKVQSGGNNQNLDRFLTKKVTAAQAKIMWALSHDFVSGITTEMDNMTEAEENLGAVGMRLSMAEEKQLIQYAGADASDVCRMCGKCEEACPMNIATTDIMRYLRYAQRYNDRKTGYAKKAYAALKKEQTSAACTGCGTCERVCPFYVHVNPNIKRADRLLLTQTFSASG
jgi:predicted aldo/keto reductase-like oxidoreductase